MEFIHCFVFFNTKLHKLNNNNNKKKAKWNRSFQIKSVWELDKLFILEQAKIKFNRRREIKTDSHKHKQSKIVAD